MPDRAGLARLPRIDDLVAAAGDLVARYGRGPATAALRAAVDVARARLLDAGGEPPDATELVAAADADLARRRPGPPRRVYNAAGVVVHTNLGRAPLSDDARQAMLDAAGYCDLEYDLATGRRGSRGARLDPLLAETAGAQDALAVNNCAAALVLTLAALAPGADVAVSRGELVEIGGSFRLPEIMAASGARLVEVGTTNRTRAVDYAVDGVALLLKVHPSNYRITGFAEAPGVAAVADVARDLGVPLVHDVGSGLLVDSDEPWLAGEPSLAGSLAEGADLVLASGDKLLGGPQAGILAGRADLVERCRRHPLARALRLDKLRIAGLVATLEAHLRGTPVPTWAMLRADPVVIAARAKALAARLGGEVTEGATLVGGGSAPGLSVRTPVVRLGAARPDAAADRLRAGDPPIVVRVDDGALWVDLRTVPPEADDLLGERLAAVLGAV
ncbi:MAG TPA: L-seryl-tRNA(Sec) selenium transferase [Egibacteraceae bacterium]|nr:L-seryl-tRNA(Sec) selenium transferase [Egibacteraceae bacterium]